MGVNIKNYHVNAILYSSASQTRTRVICAKKICDTLPLFLRDCFDEKMLRKWHPGVTIDVRTHTVSSGTDFKFCPQTIRVH